MRSDLEIKQLLIKWCIMLTIFSHEMCQKMYTLACKNWDAFMLDVGYGDLNLACINSLHRVELAIRILWLWERLLPHLLYVRGIKFYNNGFLELLQNSSVQCKHFVRCNAKYIMQGRVGTFWSKFDPCSMSA